MKASSYLALERLLILTVGLEMDGSLEAAQVANNIATELLEDIVPDPDERAAVTETLCRSVQAYLSTHGYEHVRVVSMTAVRKSVSAFLEKCKGVQL